MAELTRPFPPGSYPVDRHRQRSGRAPGLLLAAAATASRTRSSPRTRRRAACSAAGRSSSGCCRGPSRTPRSSVARAAYERYDWNSLLGEEPETRARSRPTLMDGTLLLPVAARRWRRTSRRSRSAPRSRSATTAAGPRRGCSTAADGARPVRARDHRRDVHARRRWSSRSASPSRTRRPGPGMEHAYHYADVRPAETYAGRRVLHHRQAELGLRAGQRPAAVGAPARAGVAVARPSCRSTRIARRGAGALRPAVRGPRPGRRRLDPRRGDRPGRTARRTGRSMSTCAAPTAAATSLVEVDDVISATGFVAPLRDLPDLGVATFGASRLPVGHALVGERDACPGSSSRGRSARRPRACSGTASRPTPVPSTAPATTPGCWPATSRRDRGSASKPRGRRSDRRRSPTGFVATELAEAPDALPPARLPRAACSRPTRPAGSATTASSRWRTSSTPAGRTAWPRRSRPTAAARSTRSCSPARAASMAEHRHRPGPARATARRAADARRAMRRRRSRPASTRA